MGLEILRQALDRIALVGTGRLNELRVDCGQLCVVFLIHHLLEAALEECASVVGDKLLDDQRGNFLLR